MDTAIKLRKTTTWVKLVTYISSTVIMLINNLPNAPFILTLIAAILFTNYFRQVYLNHKEPLKHRWLSLVLETSLICCLGYFDRTSANMLYFFVCLSETVIFYDLKYAGCLIGLFLLGSCVTGLAQLGLGHVINQLLTALINYAVAVAFVFAMTYLVRIQLREREKLARTNQELEQAYKQLLDNAAKAQQLSLENERTSMAREIHDTLAHTLTTLIIQLEVCKKLASADAARLPGELDKAQELARGGFNDVKRTIKALRPQVMEGKSFVESVLDCINGTMDNADVHIILNNTLPQKLKLSSTLEVSLFRLIQETMTNSIRHGQATEITIDMQVQGDNLLIDVRDNGQGCVQITKGFGLKGITERVQAVMGNVSFASATGEGFCTRVRIPLKEVENGD